MPDEINLNPQEITPKEEISVETSTDAEAVADKPTEPVLEPESAETVENKPESVSEDQTAQMAPNEPFDSAQGRPIEAARPSFSYQIRDLLAQAQDAIQGRKRKKLDKIMTMFDPSTSLRAGRKTITNDEVEKLLHVSDATATRYLSILKKEGKIIQNGRTGKGVSYSKI